MPIYVCSQKTSNTVLELVSEKDPERGAAAMALNLSSQGARAACPPKLSGLIF